MKPKRTHLEMLSGAYVDYLDPRPEDIHLDDIANNLAHCCRWVGACPYFFSVAEHACLVHDIVEAWGGSPAQRFAALHHDDHEAYTNDIPTPLKEVFGDIYREVTERLDKAIAVRLGCDPALFSDPLVKRADLLALFYEAERFKPSQGRHWEGRELVADPDQAVRLPLGVHTLGREDPETNYLQRHLALAEVCL